MLHWPTSTSCSFLLPLCFLMCTPFFFPASSMVKILPTYWSVSFLLNQSEWQLFTLYKKIIPQQKGLFGFSIWSGLIKVTWTIKARDLPQQKIVFNENNEGHPPVLEVGTVQKYSGLGAFGTCVGEDFIFRSWPFQESTGSHLLADVIGLSTVLLRISQLP